MPTNNNTLQIRVIGSPELTGEAARIIADALRSSGYNLLASRSEPYPSRNNTGDERIYLTLTPPHRSTQP